MWADTGVSLGISVGAVFAVTLILTFDFISSLIILTTICMIIVDMMGMMYWWDISLNAVSSVNLVMVSFGLGDVGSNPTIISDPVRLIIMTWEAPELR